MSCWGSDRQADSQWRQGQRHSTRCRTGKGLLIARIVGEGHSDSHGRALFVLRQGIAGLGGALNVGAARHPLVGEDGVTPTPTPTTAPTHTPTPAATTLSLGVYLTLCAPTDFDLADDATYGDLSSELAAEADRFEALTPPAQLSEWHLLYIESYRTVQAILDTQPKDDVVDDDNRMVDAAIDDVEERLREVGARLPEDVRQQLAEAGCIWW